MTGCSLTLREVLRKSIEFVQQNGGRPKIEIEHAIARVLGLRRLDLYLQFDRPLEEAEIKKIRSIIFRLAKGEPLAYLENEAHFYGHLFEVSHEVLIPRPETEILVEVARSYIGQQTAPQGTIVDLCCGSGVVGICLKKIFPTWKVILSDISKAAVEISRRNAAKMQVDVQVLQGNLAETLQGEKVDVLVANPPYLSQQEYQDLDLSVKKFEPKLALLGGVSGLEFYEVLAKATRSLVQPGGFCAFEIGATQGLAVAKLFSFCSVVQVTQDFSGYDRVVSAVV